MVLDFLQKPSAWFWKFYLRVQSKNCGKNSFFFVFFSEFFRIMSENFSDFRPKSSRSCQNYLLRVQRNTLWLNFFFKKFWTVLDFLQKPSAWFSKFYLRVQSKNCGKNSIFFVFFSEFFRIMSENFSDFRPKNFKKLSKLPSACPEEHFVTLIFLKKFWTVLDFLQKPLAWFSKIYQSVQSKHCWKNSLFLFSFQNFFSVFERTFFRLSAKKLQKVVKTNFYVSRGTVCDFNFFKKFWIVLVFLQKPSAWFSKFYLRVQSKSCGRNSFSYFSFQIFFGFWVKRFSDFRPKNFKKLTKLPSARPEEKFVAWFFLSFETFRIFCRNIWHGSQSSIYKSRVKFAEKTVFFVFFPDFFFGFWANIFQTFGQKTPKSCQNYLLPVQRNSLWL